MNTPETIKLAAVFQVMAADSQVKQAQNTERAKLASCMEVLSENYPNVKEAAHPLIAKLRAAIGLGGGRTSKLVGNMRDNIRNLTQQGGKLSPADRDVARKGFQSLRGNSLFGQQISDPRRLAATAGLGGTALGASALGAGNAMFGTSNEEIGRQAALQAALAMQQQLNDRPWYSRLGDVFGGTNAMQGNPYLAQVMSQYK